MPLASAARRIVHRPVRFDFRDVPRHWFAGNALGTQLSNAVHLLFPAGERFFIRSVRHFQDRIDDPVLREQIRAFYAQEGSHSRAHEDQFLVLEAQGHELRGFLRVYEKLAFGLLESRLSPEMRLAITAALEHYTAIMAENALRDGVLDLAHPVMRDLLLWHAAEEIEHKAVAFDVLQKVAPSYLLRMEGMAIATFGLVAFWAAGFALLVAQEKRLTGAKLEWPRETAERSLARDVFLKGILDYLRRDFHPDDRGSFELAHDYLASVGLLDGVGRAAAEA